MHRAGMYAVNEGTCAYKMSLLKGEEHSCVAVALLVYQRGVVY
jgi:hypothetical protein